MPNEHVSTFNLISFCCVEMSTGLLIIHINVTLDELFRTHGLRQLVIIDEDEGKPVGVLTRYVLLKAFEREEETSSSNTQGSTDGFEQEGPNLEDSVIA